MRRFLSILTIATTLVLFAIPSMAQDDPNPYAMADDSWISISGTVTTTTPETFMLDYGDGLVTVEMDDWDWYPEAYQLLPGDRVTVYGEIDDDLFETTTIEANSVYVESLNSFFYANDADEEDAFYTVSLPIVISETTLRGTVTNVSPMGDEFTIDTGLQQMTVETEEMLYDPLDDEGFQQIEVGDRVSVTGEIDRDLFEGRELVADSVITLEKNEMESTS